MYYLCPNISTHFEIQIMYELEPEKELLTMSSTSPRECECVCTSQNPQREQLRSSLDGRILLLY